MNKKISVIMPSYLGNYEGAASEREKKIIRAIDSFLNQFYQNKELIIISDGCDLTELIYLENYKIHNNIIFKKINKSETFSGYPRNEGLKLATGDIICYLDTDDIIGPKHLTGINESFNGNEDWIYYNDNLALSYEYYVVRDNIIELGRIGTSSIAHKNNLNISWGTGYGHDFELIKQLRDNYPKYSKSANKNLEYFVCHVPGGVDL